MCGNTLRDGIRNDAIRKKFGFANIASKSLTLVWRCKTGPQGHSWIKEISNKVEGPKVTWWEGDRKDMKHMDL